MEDLREHLPIFLTKVKFVLDRITVLLFGGNRKKVGDRTLRKVASSAQ